MLILCAVDVLASVMYRLMGDDIDMCAFRDVLASALVG